MCLSSTLKSVESIAALAFKEYKNPFLKPGFAVAPISEFLSDVQFKSSGPIYF